MVNKKGYLRTLEVMVAVLLTFAFVAYVLQDYTEKEGPSKAVNLLTPLANDIRNCYTINCVDSAIDSYDPDFSRKYDYLINISSDPNAVVTGLPAKNVYVDSVFISGNESLYSPKIIKIYYWLR